MATKKMVRTSPDTSVSVDNILPLTSHFYAYISAEDGDKEADDEDEEEDEADKERVGEPLLPRGSNIPMHHALQITAITGE